MNKQFSLINLIFASLLLLSCDDTKSAAELVPESINITPGSIIIKPEEKQQLRAQILTIDKQTIDDMVITWSSDNESIAIVDQKGLLTGKSQGTTYILATIGNVQSSIEITVSAIRRRILSELFTSST
ncbi:Ig-like domain-containing protein [bacterium]|nr:Ig-like domain-containing protein [Candidatus Neomarinimicrobiota bacterium]MDC0865604.1 Ig-like domain-containing protein [bacterium]|tara:strand:+ start:920 stop:1303 length:384 start_codon:yes stop_codon:yes gene_type:complete